MGINVMEPLSKATFSGSFIRVAKGNFAKIVIVSITQEILEKSRRRISDKLSRQIRRGIVTQTWT